MVKIFAWVTGTSLGGTGSGTEVNIDDNKADGHSSNSV